MDIFYYSKHQLSQEALDTLKTRNTKGPRAGMVEWKHVEDGFHGVSMVERVGLFQEPIDEKEVIRAWGLAKWLSCQLKEQMP